MNREPVSPQGDDAMPEPKSLTLLREAVDADEADFMDHLDPVEAARFRRFGLQLATAMDTFIEHGECD